MHNNYFDDSYIVSHNFLPGEILPTAQPTFVGELV